MNLALVSAIAAASADPVIRAGARLGSVSASWRFVSASAPYLDRNAVGFVTSVLQPGNTPSTAQIEHLAEYLSFSTACHCLDGWRYLALSAEALLRGARNEAVHLAYYAELRAALSLLAGNGIAVMKREHFSLSATPTLNHFRGNTHSTVWEALNQWVAKPTNAVALLEALTVDGISGAVWLQAVQSGLNAAAIATQWVKTWAFDLSRFPGDIELRNERSYRPDLTQDAFEPLQETEVKLVRDCIESALKTGSGAFELLDRALIFKAIEAAAALNRTGVPRSTLAIRTRRTLLEARRWFQRSNGFKAAHAETLVRNVFDSSKEVGAGLLSRAEVTNRTPSGVFCRAFLLLRMSSCLLSKYWKAINRLSPGGNATWPNTILTDYGRQAGLWDHSLPAPSFDSMGTDFDEELNQCDDWLVQHTPFNSYRLTSSIPRALWGICRFERMPLLICPP